MEIALHEIQTYHQQTSLHPLELHALAQHATAPASPPSQEGLPLRQNVLLQLPGRLIIDQRVE